jgi:MiaB-like tRNA modifying enzyme
MPRVYVESYGCAANLHDTEIMRALLREAGYEEVERPEEADLLLINTCTVKTPTANRMITRITALSMYGRPLIVAGCFAKAQPETVARINPRASLIGPDAVDQVVRVAEASMRGERLSVLDGKRVEKTLLPSIRTNPVVEIVEVSSGCLSSCTFCQTKLARGSLFSYRPATIRERVKRVVEEGVKEIWLTSQDMSAYGRDIGTNLAELLKGITSYVAGDYRIRVGMMNPLHFRRLELQELIDAYRDPHVFKFLHLCVQSGSDRVLRDMRRGYTVSDFEEYVAAFRNAFPEMTLMTDVIVGYPTEEEEDFEMTLRLLERTRPDFVNISRFFPRPKTEAARLRQLPADVVNRRSKVVTELCNEIALRNMSRWVGWSGPVLIDELGQRGEVIGRTDHYRPVVLKVADGRSLLGRWVEVVVEEARPYCLMGRVVSGEVEMAEVQAT